MYMESAIGTILISEDGVGITKVHFVGDEERVEEERSPLLLEAERQLKEYFLGERKVFELPLSLEGTEFQKKVWEQLLKIPYGETRSYGQIAAAAGNAKAGRAVGMANNRNRIAIVIPCHRVIGADGSLTGYGGGLDIKRFLLELERDGAEAVE